METSCPWASVLQEAIVISNLRKKHAFSIKRTGSSDKRPTISGVAPRVRHRVGPGIDIGYYKGDQMTMHFSCRRIWLNCFLVVQFKSWFKRRVKPSRLLARSALLRGDILSLLTRLRFLEFTHPWWNIFVGNKVRVSAWTQIMSVHPSRQPQLEDDDTVSKHAEH